MTAFVTTCRQCGTEFEPTHDAIIAGVWRVCPGCQPSPSDATHCERCGRELRAGQRTICLGCLGASAA
jgi:hypothetical protein